MKFAVLSDDRLRVWLQQHPFHSGDRPSQVVEFAAESIHSVVNFSTVLNESEQGGGYGCYNPAGSGNGCYNC